MSSRRESMRFSLPGNRATRSVAPGLGKSRQSACCPNPCCYLFFWLRYSKSRLEVHRTTWGGRSAFLHHRAAACAAAGHVTAAATLACGAGHRVTRRWKQSCCVRRRHRHGGNPAAGHSLLFHRHAVAHRIAGAPLHRGLLLHRRHAAAARPGKSSQHNGACEIANTGMIEPPRGSARQSWKRTAPL